MRVFDFKCEACGTEEEIPASVVEKSRPKMCSPEVAKALGDEFGKRDWVYCGYCGNIAWRQYTPPSLSFKGGGFTRGAV